MITDDVQVGSLVPAESAELHVVDAVHTRMGASDNLAMGSSTFLEVCHPSPTTATNALCSPPTTPTPAHALCPAMPLTCLTC